MPQPLRVREHTGMCDASASVLVDADHMLAASDEDNVLRLYRLDSGGNPVAEFDWNAALDIDPTKKHFEADIEAAARVGDRVYWVTSHGANREGEARPNRRRFFATDLHWANGKLMLTAVGTPYRHLVERMAESPGLKKFDLTERARHAPESDNGLNIEGLTVTRGGRLLIGFRNPIPDGEALLVPFLNPDPVLAGAEAPRFGKPVFLHLGGLGVRSIDYAPAHDAYFIVAGAAADGGAFALYRWTGGAGDDAVPMADVNFAELNPEAVVAPAASRKELLILSDDGGRVVDGVTCKNGPAAKRRFRSVWVTP